MPAASQWSEHLARAYRACGQLAFSHYENFPVASWVLPAAMRPHIAAVYAFARVADDIADEGDAPGADRRVQLQAWQRRLRDAVSNHHVEWRGDGRDDLIIGALSHSIRSLDLPLSLFDDLVSAFGQDTMTNRYASWADVFDYCRRSANPIGRLVLRIAGHHDEALDRSSDALCTALQLTNFWQDFGIDWRRGRLYVPRDVQEACGATEDDLSRGTISPAWAKALDACCAVTRERLVQGRMVCDGVRGRLRFELRLTWLGGHRIVTLVEQNRSRLLSYRPTLGAADVAPLLWNAARWRAAA